MAGEVREEGGEVLCGGVDLGLGGGGEKWLHPDEFR